MRLPPKAHGSSWLWKWRTGCSSKHKPPCRCQERRFLSFPEESSLACITLSNSLYANVWGNNMAAHMQYVAACGRRCLTSICSLHKGALTELRWSPASKLSIDWLLRLPQSQSPALHTRSNKGSCATLTISRLFHCRRPAGAPATPQGGIPCSGQGCRA